MALLSLGLSNGIRARFDELKKSSHEIQVRFNSFVKFDRLEILMAQRVKENLPERGIDEYNTTSTRVTPTLLAKKKVAHKTEECNGEGCGFSREIDNQVPAPHVNPNTKMILGYTRNNRLIDALQLFDEMPVKGLANSLKVRTGIGIKRDGELDEIPFQNLFWQFNSPLVGVLKHLRHVNADVFVDEEEFLELVELEVRELLTSYEFNREDNSIISGSALIAVEAHSKNSNVERGDNKWVDKNYELMDFSVDSYQLADNSLFIVKDMATMLDTKGSEVQSWDEPQPIHLEEGREFNITIKRRVSRKDNVSVNYNDFVNDVEVGDILLVDYDWTEEWYPLYLTKHVPDDAPLGLTEYDHQIVLNKDGDGTLRCYEDRCPHRLAKFSEGQLIDGKLECLYHGWQFEGQGKCVKIPQLPASANIPKAACVKTYEVKDSQGVVWVWMSTKTPPYPEKLPWFENFARPGFFDISTTHELPYDHSTLLENLMDPAHVPISHDRTEFTAKREDAQPLVYEVLKRTNRGFAGIWGREKDGKGSNLLRFDASCVLQNNREFEGKDGVKNYFSGLFICRPTGQGKSMLIVRIGVTKRSALVSVLPQWFWHQNACKVFEQDMGFLSSQNEVLMKKKVPTKDLYLNLKSSDTWVAEYRKWMDKVGHVMPYQFGHRTISLPKVPPVVEHAPAGLIAALSATYPAKGGIGTMHAPSLANRYFRHIIHCRSCSNVIKSFELWKNILSAIAVNICFFVMVAKRYKKLESLREELKEIRYPNIHLEDKVSSIGDGIDKVAIPLALVNKMERSKSTGLKGNNTAQTIEETTLHKV